MINFRKRLESQEVTRYDSLMRSGQIIVLVMVVLIAAMVCLGMFLWAQRHASETQAINAEQKAFFEKKVDSLHAEIDQLKGQLALPVETRDTMYTHMLRTEISFLRKQIEVVTDTAAATVGVDSIEFYVRHLGDSTFVSHYGDFDEATVWYIAAERLGMMGTPAIGPLIRHLDSARGFDLGQTLYALSLASQHESVKAITGGELPPVGPGQETAPTGVQAWRSWAAKWKLL